jgi:peptidoglycan/xylan/chitin deacetylase (PgdA/CDA1 family)
MKKMITVLLITLILGSTSYATEVPVLMYHHIVEDNPQNASIVTREKITQDLRYLKVMGYNTITLEELETLEVMPDKPIIITLDDGYRSNYDILYPLLKELDMKVSISLIGYYLEKELIDGRAQIPKLTVSQIQEMHQSNLVDFQNHTFNMHYSSGETFTGAKIGKGIMPMENEKNPDYQLRVLSDILLNHYYIYSITGDYPEFFCYPYGLYNDSIDTVLRTLNYKGTITTQPGINRVYSNSDLYRLNRFNVSESTNLRDIVNNPHLNALRFEEGACYKKAHID